MVVGQRRHAAPPGGAGEKAQLHEVRLVDILQRHGFLADGGGQGFQAHRAAAVVLNDGGEHPAVDVVKPQLVHFQTAQSKVGGLLRDCLLYTSPSPRD